MKLELGYNQPPEIRHYTYPFEPLAGKRLLYISDLHYHRISRRRVDQHIRQIKDIDPHLLLLGGDYIDTPFGLPNLRHLLTSLGSIPRYAIGGNHDAPWLSSVRQTIESTGTTWIHNDSTIIQLGAATIRIDGTRPASPSPRLLTQTGAPADLSILNLHHPINVEPLAHRYNLIFAGHLHGGQIILWQTPKGLYPVKWRYKWNILDKTYGPCYYILSKGLGDTFPIRYNCRRDAILVTFEPNPKTP